MVRDLENSKPGPQARIMIVRGRVPWVVMLLALLLTSTAGEARSVHAAPPPPHSPLHSTVSLRINMGGSRVLCTNHDYPIYVTPWEGGGEFTDYKGGIHHLDHTNLAGWKIEAYVQDTGVATISPPRAMSGWDNGEGDVNAVMAATFSLHARKPGTTRVYFKAKIFGQYVGPGIDIQVVPCKFRVLVRTTALGQIPAITEIARYTMKGEMSGEGALTGGAGVNWITQQATPCFVIKQTVPDSTAKFEGNVSEDGRTLTGQISFAAASLSNTGYFTCGRAVSASKQLQLQPPPISFKVPVTGGTVFRSVAFPFGDVVLKGQAEVTVVPIPDY
jgi:hypothetical protein